MKYEKIFLLFEILSTVFILILGTILHFTFAFSNNNHIGGVFSAVNESTWKHLKLLFFPMLITIIIGFFVKNKSINCVCNMINYCFILYHCFFLYIHRDYRN